MREISSTSELTTKEIVEQAIQDYHMSILPYLAKGNNGYSETPIGAIQFFDDDTAPSGWLVADGTVYNIDDYPFLANHYERVHGSKNHYGGDGITTFAVPDWRGEFFRASGPNAHPNQGDGAAVGEHQDGTTHVRFQTANGNRFYSANDETEFGNTDYNNTGNGQTFSGAMITAGGNVIQTFTSRPTCTSGLCCIKAVPAGIIFSEDEQYYGKWIDGSDVWWKTVDLGSEVNVSSTSWYTTNINGTNEHIGQILKTEGISLQYGTAFPMVGHYLLSDSNYVKLLLGRDNDTSPIRYVILYYTKTTD